jgi:4'-phosphopantetheinyl transferase
MTTRVWSPTSAFATARLLEPFPNGLRISWHRRISGVAVGVVKCLIAAAKHGNGLYWWVRPWEGLLGHLLLVDHVSKLKRPRVQKLSSRKVRRCRDVKQHMNVHDSKPQIVVAELSRNCLLEPPVPELTSSMIHIWEFPLTHRESDFDNHATLLSEDEHTRASRFHFERDARRFTLARASVRSILGRYTGIDSRDLRFDYSRYGKPSLSDVDPDIRFNVSHSADVAMLAVALGAEVGVDLEKIRTDVETDKLAERFFSPQERESLGAIPNQCRVPAFFRCWTCKEAFLKAEGLGLSRSLESFDVEVNPERPARLLSTRPNPEDAGRWSLDDLPTQPDYAAALATLVSLTAIQIFRCL